MNILHVVFELGPKMFILGYYKLSNQKNAEMHKLQDRIQYSHANKLHTIRHQ